MFRSAWPVLLLCVAGSSLAAPPYPNHPVRWIVPLAPGGSTDFISRLIAQGLAEKWAMQVVAENRPGSGGTIGLAAAAKAAPDGYTIVLAQLSNVALAPGFYPGLPYDPVTQLSAVTQVTSTPMMVVANATVPAKNIPELITLARARPNWITYGSAGNGSIGHLAAEMLKTMSGVKMTHVPYKGASQAITDLVGGQISLSVTTIPPALPFIRSGRLRALGVTSAARVAMLPDVPTVAESGMRDYAVYNWFGVMVPAGTPGEIVAQLHGDIVGILNQPLVRQRLVSDGGEVVANRPDEFAAFIRSEIPKWTKVIKAAGARAD